MRYLDEIWTENVKKIVRKNKKKMAWDLAKTTYTEKTWRGAILAPPGPDRVNLYQLYLSIYCSVHYIQDFRSHDRPSTKGSDNDLSLLPSPQCAQGLCCLQQVPLRFIER